MAYEFTPVSHLKCDDCENLAVEVVRETYPETGELDRIRFFCDAHLSEYKEMWKESIERDA